MPKILAIRRQKQAYQKFKVILGHCYILLALPTLQETLSQNKTKNLKRIASIVDLTKAIHPGTLPGQNWWCAKSPMKRPPWLQHNTLGSVRIEPEINYLWDKENNFQNRFPWQTHIISNSEGCALVCNPWCGLSSYRGWRRAQSVYAQRLAMAHSTTHWTQRKH